MVHKADSIGFIEFFYTRRIRGAKQTNMSKKKLCRNKACLVSSITLELIAA